ncbi:hypothetical protein EVAR_103843_1 [Eumeta japonica]|uniref:CCHC-type domain-containing protein n=1 Tax=Eumeta variegata TaxID=151549 RepID=A0A4C2AB58_EUMVA|nr:hypothetical protein EVAR_103843_1 [Eumeta japonica]
MYIGWEVVEVCDYLGVTCCRKCQQYGHPEKFCRSKDEICGKCGAVGHRRDDCTSQEEKCATCHRFGKRDAHTHTTAAANCPARPQLGRIGARNSGTAEYSTRTGLDIVLVQEQYTESLEILQVGENAKAGTYLANSNVNCAVLQQYSSSHCVVCSFDALDIVTVSAYFQYSDEIDVYITHLERVLDQLKGRRVLIAVDSYGRIHTEPRPHIAESEGEPSTYVGGHGESNIDVTLTTRGIKVEGWTMLPDVSSSDHRLIEYMVYGERESAARTEPIEEPGWFRDRGCRLDSVRVGNTL